MMDIAGKGLHVDLGGLDPKDREERREQLDHRGIDHEEAESPLRDQRVEGRMVRSQCAHAVKNGAHGLRQFEGFGRRLHLERDAHEQRVAEVKAKAREGFAQRRLRHIEHARAARQISLYKQDVEDLQMLQIELAIIDPGNRVHQCRR